MIVVVPTNISGPSVTHAYAGRFASFNKIVVPTASATEASS